MGGPRGLTGCPDPLPEKSQKYRVSLQYWCGAPEIHKATKQVFNVGQKSGIWILYPLSIKNHLKKRYQIWTPSEKTF